MCVCVLTGEDGALLHWDLLRGGGDQAAGPGLCVPQRLLPEERLERHGLHRGPQRVSETWHGRREHACDVFVRVRVDVCVHVHILCFGLAVQQLLFPLRDLPLA